MDTKLYTLKDSGTLDTTTVCACGCKTVANWNFSGDESYEDFLRWIASQYENGADGLCSRNN